MLSETYGYENEAKEHPHLSVAQCIHFGIWKELSIKELHLIIFKIHLYILDFPKAQVKA